MREIEGWCITRKSGVISYGATHNFTPYETWLLKTPKYKCICGLKITPEEYLEYSKYLIARKKAMDAYLRNK